MPQRPVLLGSQQGRSLLGGSSQFDRARSLQTESVDRTDEILAQGQAAVGKTMVDFGQDLFNFAVNHNEDNKRKQENTINANKGLISAQIDAQIKTMQAQGELLIREGIPFDFAKGRQDILDNYGSSDLVSTSQDMSDAFNRYVKEMGPIHASLAERDVAVQGAVLETTQLNMKWSELQRHLTVAEQEGFVPSAVDLFKTAGLLAKSKGASKELKMQVIEAAYGISANIMKSSINLQKSELMVKLEESVIGGEITDLDSFRTKYRELSVNAALATRKDLAALWSYLGGEKATEVDLDIQTLFQQVTDTESSNLYNQFVETRTAKLVKLFKGQEDQYVKTMEDSSGSLQNTASILGEHRDQITQLENAGELTEEAQLFNVRVTAAEQVIDLVNDKLFSVVNTVYTNDAKQAVFKSSTWRDLGEKINELSDKVRLPDEQAELTGLQEAKKTITNYLNNTSAYDIAVDATKNNSSVDSQKKGVSANNVEFSRGNDLKLNRSLKQESKALLSKFTTMDAPAAYKESLKMVGAIGEHYKEHDWLPIPEPAFSADMFNDMFRDAGDAYTPEQKMLLSTAFSYASEGDENSFSKLFTAAKGAMGAKLVAGTQASLMADMVAIEHLTDARASNMREAFLQNDPFGGAMDARNAELFLSRLALGLAEADGRRLSIDNRELKDLTDNSSFMDDMKPYIKEAQRLMLNGKEPITTGRSSLVVNIPNNWSVKQVSDTVAYFETNIKRKNFRENPKLGLRDDQFLDNQSWANTQVSNSKDGSGIIVTFPSETGAQQPVGYYQGLSTKVLSVDDGDTMKVNIEDNSVSIRLKNIDTFEKSQEGGPEATAALKALVGKSGGEVRLVFSNVDKYGRPVATVKGKDGENINLTMVREGNAVAFMTSDKEIIGAHNKNFNEGVYDGRVSPFAYKRDKTSKQAITEAISQDYPTVMNMIYIPMEKLMSDYGSLDKRITTNKSHNWQLKRTYK
jgi:endonuclease YncB( thermonuclease family)